VTENKPGNIINQSLYINILWPIDTLLGKDVETNNEITAVAMQQHGKHASATIVTVGNGVMKPVASQVQQLDYNNGNRGAVYMVLTEEDNLGYPVSFKLSVDNSNLHGRL
jgi:hypothetical protein